MAAQQSSAHPPGTPHAEPNPVPADNYILLARDLFPQLNTWTKVEVLFSSDNGSVLLRFPVGRSYTFRSVTELGQALDFLLTDARIANK